MRNSVYRHSCCDCSVESGYGVLDKSVGDHTLMIAGVITKSISESESIEKLSCGAVRVTAVILSAYQLAMTIGMSAEELDECAEIALRIHRDTSEVFRRKREGEVN